MSVVDEDVSMASGSEISSSDRLDEEGWVEPDWDESFYSYSKTYENLILQGFRPPSSSKLPAKPNLHDLKTHQNYVLDRLKQLRANYGRKLPPVAEPQRNTTTWDHLLGEMEWMSRDFERERKLKLNNAKKISKSIRVHHLHKKSSKREDTIDYEKIKKKIAQQVSRMVSHYWKSVEKLAVHLQKLQIEKKRHEERSKRLDKLVDKQLELSHRVAEDLQRKKAPIYINLVKRNNLWKVSEEEDEADYAAKVASDFQPKGFTLDTTSVVTKIPFMLKGKLREYQHIGLDWLTTLHDKKLNGILADEMGLGKTIQTISMLAYLACERGIWGPHLIVVPTSIMMNWEMELKRWCPGLKVLTYFGNQKERKQKRIGWSKPNSFHVCITSYKLVVQDHFAFKRKQWYYLILDEAQHIKNFQSKRWQILLRFNSRRKLLLTGTPLQNDVIELWSLLHFLMPNLFASHDDFQAWFSSPFNSAMATDSDFNATVVNRLQSILRPFLLRRLKKDVEKQLPVKTEHVIFCPLSRRQQFLYDEFLERRGNQDGDTIGIMNILMQLRKVCNHPDLFSPRDVYSPFRMTDLKYLIPPILLLHFIKQEFILTYFSLLSNEQYSKIESSRLQSLKSPMTLLQAYKMYNDTTQMKHEYFNLSGQSVLKPRDSSILNMLPYLTPDDFPIPLKRTFVSPACLPFLTTQTYPIITISEKQHKLRSEFLSSFQSINDLRIDNSYPVYGIRLRNMLTFNSSKLENMVDITHFSCNNECCSNKAEDMEIDIEEPIKKYRKDSSYFQEVYREDIFRELFSCQDIWINENPYVFMKFQVVPPKVLSSGVKQDFHKITHATDVIRRQILAYTLQLSDSTHSIHNLINRRFLVFPDKYALEHDCGKLRKLSGLLKSLQNQGHRCLIFTQMSRMLDILEKFLNLHGYTYVRLDGSTKVQDRQKFVDRFNLDERIFAFISSTRSGGLGLNLTGADTVIFYDTDWNPAMDKQAQDRCHRIGQTRSVHIYRLISSYTIEENILKKALQKLHLDQLIMEGGEFNTHRLQSSRIKVRDLFEEIKDEEIEQACKMVEDAEDYKAFRKAQQEEQTDKIDFDDDGKIEMNEYEFLDQVDPVTRQAIDNYISLNPLDEQDVPIAESGQLSDNEPDNDESDFEMKAQMCENGESIYRERLELLKSRYIVY